MKREEIKLRLEDVMSPKRYIHSLNVMNTAVDLAGRYGYDKEKAAVAGLLHDCARDIRGDEVFQLCTKYGISIDDVMRAQPELLHGPIGSEIVRQEYGIEDKPILRAIYYHTTGCENMGLLEKIVYIADYIEPNRNFPGINEARELAFKDINKAMVFSLDRTIKHVLAKGSLIHPSTIGARNYIIMHDIKEVSRPRQW